MVYDSNVCGAKVIMSKMHLRTVNIYAIICKLL